MRIEKVSRNSSPSFQSRKSSGKSRISQNVPISRLNPPFQGGSNGIQHAYVEGNMTGVLTGTISRPERFWFLGGSSHLSWKGSGVHQYSVVLFFLVHEPI